MVVQTEQLHDGFDVPVAFHVIGDPAGLRMQVVQRRLPVRHELFANADRKRQIRQALSVQMTDLPVSNMEEDHSVRIDVDTHLGPGAHFTLNALGNGVRRHLGLEIRRTSKRRILARYDVGRQEIVFGEIGKIGRKLNEIHL